MRDPSGDGGSCAIRPLGFRPVGSLASPVLMSTGLSSSDLNKERIVARYEDFHTVVCRLVQRIQDRGQGRVRVQTETQTFIPRPLKIGASPQFKGLGSLVFSQEEHNFARLTHGKLA